MLILQKYGFKVCVISFCFYSSHYKVYIHLPCMNTQRRTTAPFDITHVISSGKSQTLRLYQGWANRCEVDCNSYIFCLLQSSQTIHNCNQSVLAIFPYLNILVWSIIIFWSHFEKCPGTVLFYYVLAIYITRRGILIRLNGLRPSIFCDLWIYVLLLRFGISPFFHILENTWLCQLILYIECVIVVWEHIVQAHGGATALNRESFGIVFFLLISILYIPVHE